MQRRTWDANSYDRVGTSMTAMAAAVVDRLALRGDETVLDAGCGTGRVSRLLLDRLPRGNVISVDADPDMVRLARQNLGDAATVKEADLLHIDLPTPVDAVLSTATFHWVLDHAALFRSLHSVLRPGGSLVAQCGGEGNIAELRGVGEAVAALPEFVEYFHGWEAPWYYASPDVTIERLEAAGFENIRVWLEPWPVVPDDPGEYVATVTMGAQVQRLPEDRRGAYVQAVLDRMPEPFTVDYIRLNIDAERPVDGPRA